MVRPRDGVGAPGALAALGVVGVEEAADAELAARNPGDDAVLDDERRRRLAVARPIVGHLLVPDDVPGPCVEGDQVGVEGAHVERLAQDGHAAVVAPAADAQVVGERVLVAPVGPAGGRVDRRHVARRLGDEHHAVDHERRRLGPVELADRVGPLQLQVRHRAAVDLVEAAEALAVERPRVHQPVVRLVGGMDEALPGDGRERHRIGAAAGRRLLRGRFLTVRGRPRKEADGSGGGERGEPVHRDSSLTPGCGNAGLGLGPGPAYRPDVSVIRQRCERVRMNRLPRAMAGLDMATSSRELVPTRRNRSLLSRT